MFTGYSFLLESLNDVEPSFVEVPRPLSQHAIRIAVVFKVGKVTSHQALHLPTLSTITLNFTWRQMLGFDKCTREIELRIWICTL